MLTTCGTSHRRTRIPAWGREECFGDLSTNSEAETLPELDGPFVATHYKIELHGAEPSGLRPVGRRARVRLEQRRGRWPRAQLCIRSSQRASHRPADLDGDNKFLRSRRFFCYVDFMVRGRPVSQSVSLGHVHRGACRLAQGEARMVGSRILQIAGWSEAVAVRTVRGIGYIRIIKGKGIHH